MIVVPSIGCWLNFKRSRPGSGSAAAEDRSKSAMATKTNVNNACF
jgi:hypothetical protein